MIQIFKIQKSKINDIAKLYAMIEVNGDTKELFYETTVEYYNHLCDSKVDAFILAMLPFALLTGQDIKTENPISEKLYVGLTEILIPALIKMNSRFSEIDILSTKIQENSIIEKGSATGISCGVDSFYTVLSNMEKNNEDLKHLTYFESLNYGENYLEEKESFSQDIIHPRKVSAELNLNFIPVFSNVNVFMKDFAYEQIHTFSNLSHALVLQNIIGDYYYSTAFPETSHKLDFSDSGNYDNLSQKAICTGLFRMVSYGGLASRMDKTKAIAPYEIVQKNLDVCLKKKDSLAKRINCSECAKCIRTMVSLDVNGLLDDFDNVFDTSLYYQNKAKYWADIFYKKVIGKSEFSEEIINEAKEKGVTPPIKSYLYFVQIGLVNQLNKLKRRIK